MTNKERIMMWLKGAGALFVLFAYAIGLIGGVGYLFYFKQYVPAICVAVCCVVAFPKVKEYFNRFIE